LVVVCYVLSECFGGGPEVGVVWDHVGVVGIVFGTVVQDCIEVADDLQADFV
jgi:hypothetical protein